MTAGSARPASVLRPAARRVRDAALDLTVRALGLLGRAQRAARGGPARGAVRSVLLLPPTAPGSVGDEAMLMAAVAQLVRDGVDRIGLLSYERWPSDAVARHPLVTSVAIPEYFASWGFRSLPRCARVAARHDAFFLIGADVLDGFYSEHATRQRLRLAELAARTGAQTVVGGFSFSPTATAPAARALRRLPASVVLRSRDPVSRTAAQVAAGRPVELASDLAFLLDPSHALSPAVAATQAWVRGERAAGATVVGLNLNAIVCRLVPGTEAAGLVAACGQAVALVLAARPDVRFLLLPHDARGELSDVALARQLHAGAPSAVRDRLHLLGGEGHAEEIKTICGELDLVVSGRMHLSIAALGMGTPAVSLDYQGKVAGMFLHFGLEHTLLEPEDFVRPERLAGRILAALASLPELREQVRGSAAGVRALAASNLRFAAARG